MERKTIWNGSTRMGEDVITTERDGLIHIAHYDNHNNLIGRSYETRDYKGEVYMIHEDARGNRLGRSTMERDWWGEYYVKTEKSRRGAETEQRDERERYTREDNRGDDCSPVIEILYAITMVGVKIFAGLMGYAFVAMMAMPLAAEILMVSLNNAGNAAEILFGFLSILVIAYFPYVGILLYRRWKKHINWKDFFLAFLRWYIIGPFAYRWLLQKPRVKGENLHRPNDLPYCQCPNCGKNIFTDAQFCSSCGTKLHV